MRRNFLILMLLSLLPLAVWAQNTLDGATVTFTKANLVYDGTDQTLPTASNVTVKKGDVTANEVIIVWKNSDNETVTTAKLPGGYTYTITSGNLTGSISGTYRMEKRMVKVKAEDKSIAYGDDVPAFTGAGVWSYQTGVSGEGFVAGDLKDDGSVKDNIVTGAPTFTTNYVKKNAKSDGDHVYKITPDVKEMSADNYDFGYVQGTLTVTAKAFVADNTEKFTIAAENDVYDGADYKAEPTIVDVVLNETLAKTTDYNLTYFKDNEGAIGSAASDNDLTNAGTYWVKATGTGNYSGELSVSYKVTKKGLAISTGSREITYGETLTAPVITYEGLIAADAESDGSPKSATYKTEGSSFALKYKKGSATATTTLPSGQGTYDVTAYAKKSDGTELKADEVFTNYTPIYFNGGTVTINKKVITFTMNPQSRPYGETHAVEAKDGVKITTEALATEYYKIVPATYATDGWSASANMLANGDAITTTKQGVAKLNSAKNKVTATFTSDFEIKNGSTAVTSNYDVRVVDADFTIEKGTIYVRALNKEIKFGDAAITDFDIQVSGGESADQTSIKNALKTKVQIASTGKHLDETTGATYPNAGKYDLTFSDLDLGEALNAKYNVEPFYGTYTINKAYVNVNAKAQVHMVGEAVTATASAETIELALITDEEDANYANRAAVLPTGADLTAIYSALSLEYNTTALSSYIDTESKLKAEALEHGTVADGDAVNGVYYNGIIINATKVSNYDAANNNFVLTAAFAQLTVTSADIVDLDKDAEDNVTTITANKNLKKNVRIKGRKLYANQWNAVTLPFAVNPLEFCKAINAYAVFDVLQTSGEKMNFKITINDIEAYTPFLVKVDKEIALNDITFNKVTIEPINDENLTQSNDAYSFVGTLNKGDYDGKLWSFQPNDDNGDIKVLLRAEVDEKYSINAFNAYITSKEANADTPAPVIIIEEADGSTTSIVGVNAEGIAVTADGWYTLNGVKLNAAPTQKGIYIQNGKKVVVK
ncbi:MAG: hypothetical protein IJ588_02805 [Prevotella sp.]|nr:hypothetical protein [Prevotella sp.]